MLLYNGVHHSRKIFIARFPTYIAANITVSALQITGTRSIYTAH
jgi:hypothetical protein